MSSWCGTGRYKVTWGSWGGAEEGGSGMWLQVDLLFQPPAPANTVTLQGSSCEILVNCQVTCSPRKQNGKLVSQRHCGWLSSPPGLGTIASFPPLLRGVMKMEWVLHFPHLSLISHWDHSRNFWVMWLRERSEKLPLDPLQGNVTETPEFIPLQWAGTPVSKELSWQQLSNLAD